jgi:hypothetical protein
MDKQAALPTQGNRVIARQATQGRTKIKPLLGVFFVLALRKFSNFFTPPRISSIPWS